MAEELDERLDDEDKDGQVLVSIPQFSRNFFPANLHLLRYSF